MRHPVKLNEAALEKDRLNEKELLGQISYVVYDNLASRIS